MLQNINNKNNSKNHFNKNLGPHQGSGEDQKGTD